MKKIALLALLLAGCAFAPARGPARVETPARSSAIRLGWLMWEHPDVVIFCNRRLDDDGNPIGVTGPCFRATVEQPAPKRIVAFVHPGKPDPSPPDVAPPGCSLQLEEVQFVPASRPARAWLVSPSGRTLLDEWAPAPEVNGDRFVLETSLSPDGKWLALAHLAVGVGEGMRTIEFAGVVFKPAAGCR